MKIFHHFRPASLIAACAGLLLSAHASATQVSQNLTINGFTGLGGVGGTLSIIFEGDTGVDNFLNHPAEVTSFSASYTDSAVGTVEWSLLGLGGLLWDNDTNTLLALTAIQLPPFPPSGGTAFVIPPFLLNLGAAVAFGRDEFSTIEDQIGIVATKATPVPGTVLLLSVGLLMLARRRS